MQQLCAGLDALDIGFIPSVANFVTFKVPEVTESMQLYQGLLQAGVIVRPLQNYGMGDYLRVSIGLEQENTFFLEQLKGICGS